MFKKIISLLLSSIIILSLVFSISLTANAASPTLTVSSKSAYLGDDVTVTVNISSGSNIASGNLVLQYDSSKLEVKSATHGSVVSTFNPIVNPNYGDTGNKIKLVIYTGTNSVITSSGTILSVAFKAISTGNAEVKISESRFSDINGNVISTTKSNGSVTISQKQTTSYTLSYNANGGSGAPLSQSGSTTYTISSTEPTRSGYTFLGWSKSNSATSATYSPGGSIALTANTTLYAVWSKNPYDVILYSGVDIATFETFSTTGNLTFTTPASISGWTTLGWRKDTTASAATYSSTGSTTVSGNSIFYAVYSKSLSVTFNANGGSGAPSSQSVTRYYNSYGNYSTASLTLSSTKPTRSGYTFLGWSTSSSATSATYSAGGSVTLTADTTLYAVWSKNQVTTYTLSYNANGGSGAPANQTGSTTYTISSTKPTRSGYTFLGWSTSSSATSATYSVGDSITLTANTTLYAVWNKSQQTTYTLSYNVMGGISAPEPQYGFNDFYNVSLWIPIREGYQFVGWVSTDSFETKTNSSILYPGSEIYLGEDITLYAVWALESNIKKNEIYNLKKEGPNDINIVKFKPDEDGTYILNYYGINNAMISVYDSYGNLVNQANADEGRSDGFIRFETSIDQIYTIKINGVPVNNYYYEIKVLKYVSNIAFDPAPNKISYRYKDSAGNPSMYNGRLKVTTCDGVTEYIEDYQLEQMIDGSKIKVYGFDLSSVGDKTMTLVYEGYTIDLNYNVSYAWWQWIIRIFLLGFLWY